MACGHGRRSAGGTQRVGFCSTIARLLTYLPLHLVKLGDRGAQV